DLVLDVVALEGERQPEAGAVDEHVHRPGRVRQTRADRVDPVGGGEIRGQHLDLRRAEALELAGQRSEPLPISGDQDQAVPAAGVLGAEPGAGTCDQRCARHGPEGIRPLGPPTSCAVDQPSRMVILAIFWPSRSKRKLEGPLAWEERQSPVTVTESSSVSTSVTVRLGAEPMNWASLQAWISSK